MSLTNPYGNSVNKSDISGKFRTITLCNSDTDKNHTDYGDLTVATDCEVSFSQSYWYRGKWKDSVVTFWNEFSGEKFIKDRTYDEVGKNDTCTLIAEVDAKPDEKKKIRFVISWNVPNNCNYWTKEDAPDIRKPWKNYYATIFENSAHCFHRYLCAATGKLGIGRNDSRSMTGKVEFRDNIDKSVLAEGHNVFDFLFSIISAVGLHIFRAEAVTVSP